MDNKEVAKTYLIKAEKSIRCSTTPEQAMQGLYNSLKWLYAHSGGKGAICIGMFSLDGVKIYQHHRHFGAFYTVKDVPNHSTNWAILKIESKLIMEALSKLVPVEVYIKRNDETELTTYSSIDEILLDG